jgi:hypothetical protein
MFCWSLYCLSFCVMFCRSLFFFFFCSPTKHYTEGQTIQ